LSFDAKEAFQELADIWPLKRRNKTVDFQIFESRVMSQEAFEKLLERAKIVIEDGTSQTLAMFISSETKKVSKSPVALTSLYPTEQDSPELLEAFETVWAQWPRHFSWPESRESAFSGFRSFVKKNGLSGVVETCSFYATTFNDPTSGMIHPYHLSNFLGDSSKFAEWSARAVFAPSQTDIEDFNAVWAWYPRAGGSEKQKKDALLFWLRHVKPEQRFDFLASVKSYHRVLNEIKYAKNLIGFIGDWKTFLSYSSIAADISKGILEIVPAEAWKGQTLMNLSSGLTNQVLGRLQSGTTKGKIQDTISDICAVVVEQNKKLGSDIVLDPVEVYNAAYRQAAKPPKTVA
jgi:hypothetical protein